MGAAVLERARRMGEEAVCLLSLGLFVASILVTTLTSLVAAYLLFSTHGSSALGWGLATLQVGAAGGAAAPRCRHGSSTPR